MRPFCTHKHLINLAPKHRPFISFRSLRPPLFLRSFSDASSSRTENTPSSGPENRNTKPELESASEDVTYASFWDTIVKNAIFVVANREKGVESFSSERFGEKGKGQIFWVCSLCSHREAKRWETCRMCMCTGYGRPEKASVVEGLGSDLHRKESFGHGLKLRSSSGGNDLNIDMSSESVRTSEDSVVEGSGSDFHKGIEHFSGERAFGHGLEQRSISGGNDLNIGMSSESVRTSEVEVSEKGVNWVGGGVHPLPLTMKPEVESASDGVAYVSLLSLWDRSVKNAIFVVANRGKGVEYFSSEGLTRDLSKKSKLVSRSESRYDFDEKGSSKHGFGQEFSIWDVVTMTAMKKKRMKIKMKKKKSKITYVYDPMMEMLIPQKKSKMIKLVYDPMTEMLIPQRGLSNGQKEEPGSGSGGDGRRTYLDERDRTYGNVKKAQSERGLRGLERKGRPRVSGFARIVPTEAR